MHFKIIIVFLQIAFLYIFWIGEYFVNIYGEKADIFPTLIEDEMHM